MPEKKEAPKSKRIKLHVDSTRVITAVELKRSITDEERPSTSAQMDTGKIKQKQQKRANVSGKKCTLKMPKSVVEEVPVEP